MIKVHVLCGGQSSEREVSLRSGAAVANALRRAGYDITVLDPATAGLDEIIACDVVFPVLHGKGGEDGTLQAQLEQHHVRFVGSDSAASGLCFDKWRYREHIESYGLPVAPAALVQQTTYQAHELAKAPYVLKPVDGGSSIDTCIIRDPAQAVHDQIAETFHRHPTLLMERLIIGTELTVGTLGTTPLPVIEIVPPLDGEFDYENKYNGATLELCPPQHVDQAAQQQAQALAKQAHKLTGCRDLSRTDCIYETASGTLFLLETNTMPGMTDQSLFPKMAQANGLSMQQLCTRLVEAALTRDSPASR
jgi:D-alanine-D-alanine ligase